MVKITIHDVVSCQVSEKHEIKIVRPFLTYKSFFRRYSKSKKRWVREVYEASFVDHQTGFFPTGLLNRLTKALKKKGIKYRITGELETLALTKTTPVLKGIDFRKDQIELLDNFFIHQRGVLVAPTGSGKTVIAGAIFSCFSNKKRLFICHKKSLLVQAHSDFIGFGLKDISLVTEGKIDLSGSIVLATRQTFIKIPPKEYADLFDVVLVDEVHHVSDPKSEYAFIFGHMLAPVRGGVTATYPRSKKDKLTIEGAVGPIIGEFTIEEAIKRKILAVPKIDVWRTPVYADIREIKNYDDTISEGVVHNEAKNFLIMQRSKQLMQKGESVLIFVTQVEHGENLKEAAEELGLDIPFIFSNTSAEDREKYRHKLNDKKILGAIATNVWQEGINVRTLDNVVLAHVGKKWEAIMQYIGRGMRRTKDKHVFKVVDIFDPSNPHLVRHFGYRVSYYSERGWL